MLSLEDRKLAVLEILFGSLHHQHEESMTAASLQEMQPLTGVQSNNA